MSLADLFHMDLTPIATVFVVLFVIGGVIENWREILKGLVPLAALGLILWLLMR